MKSVIHQSPLRRKHNCGRTAEEPCLRKTQSLLKTCIAVVCAVDNTFSQFGFKDIVVSASVSAFWSLTRFRNAAARLLETNSKKL
ncbi:hypothetical protein LXL04_034383 [Taraxacum kok-saghyz]